MAGLRLKRGKKAQVSQGHPWVFAGEVEKLLPGEYDGEVVECRDARGFLLGVGFYNSRSQIVWRRLSRKKIDLSEKELEQRIITSIARRKKEDVRRLVWSESDFLPGLVVDQYGTVLVVQTLTLGMERRLETIIGILVKLLQPTSIVARNDVPSRKLDGLEENVFTAYGPVSGPQWRRIGELEFWVDVTQGQKTGWYLDQRAEYEAVAGFCEGKEVLDCFCNQGGFALHAVLRGAKKVCGVDISAEALEKARLNADHNHLKVEWVEANVFDFLRSFKKQSWEVIVLDPPPFARGKKNLEEACRGYKEINLRALQALEPGGVLATYCCSHHVVGETFRKILIDAAADARKDVQILSQRCQHEDHPILLNAPQSEYLQGYFLQVV